MTIGRTEVLHDLIRVSFLERTGDSYALKVKLNSGTQGHVVSAAIEFERIAIAGSLWKCAKPIRASTAPLGGRPMPDRVSEPAVRPLALNSN